MVGYGLILVLSISFVIGIVSGIVAESALLGGILALLAIAFFFYPSGKGKSAVFLSFVVLLVIGFCFGWLGSQRALEFPKSCPNDDICALAGQKVVMEGEIVSIPSKRLERSMVEVDVGKVDGKEIGGKILAILPHTRYNLFYGDSIVLKGKVKLPESSDDDHFSYPLFLANKGIFSLTVFPEVESHVNNEYSLWSWKGMYQRLLVEREKVRGIIEAAVPEPYAAVSNAMLIGDQKGIPSSILESLSHTGIIHIISVSGAHVTLLAAIIGVIGNWMGLRRITLFLVVITGIAIYILLAGAPSCAVRSGLMGMLVLLALTRGRFCQMKNAIWSSAAILLYFNPLSIAGDIGFQLSFLAVFGMAYVYPLFEKSFLWDRKGKFWTAVKLVFLSLSIEVMVAPMVYYYFGIISWVSPLANLVLLPPLSALLPLSLLLVIVGKLGLPVSLLGFLIYMLLNLIQKGVDLLESVPGSFALGETKPGWVVLYYILLFISVLITRKIIYSFIFLKRLEKLSNLDSFEGRLKKKKFPLTGFWKGFLDVTGSIFLIGGFKGCRVAQYVTRGWILLISLLAVTSSYYLYSSSLPPRLTMLNVEQGDAFLLNWPRYHFQMLVDGGPGKRVLPELGSTLPFYDRQIEFVLLSHADQDHLEGVVSLEDRYAVSTFILPYLPSKRSDFLYQDFWRQLQEESVVLLSKRGKVLNINEGKNMVAEFLFLSPFADYPSVKDNDRGMVFRMAYPREILFTGDAEWGLEKLLVEKELGNLESEILKVSHHGSSSSTTSEFLNAVNPRTALISVGKNSFGHPAEDVLKRLSEKGVEVFRTDLDGRVEIVL